MAGLGASAAALTGARLLGQTPGMGKFDHLSPDHRVAVEAAYARMMKAFAFERVTVAGDRALVEWERLKRAGRGWPVVIGGDEQLERLADQFSFEDSMAAGATGLGGRQPPDSIIHAADAIRWPGDLAKWEGAYAPADLKAPVGDWPTHPEAPNLDEEPGLSVATDIQTRRPLARVHILLVPTQHGWQVPAHLRWGGWNACPPPEYHIAALRSWHERFGAELVGIDGDTLNIRVARRPRSRDEALALAREQYHYCPDLIDQGVGTLSALAAGLLASDWWFFWWD